MKRERTRTVARGLLWGAVLAVLVISAGVRLAPAADRFLTSLERELGDLFEQSKESVVTIRSSAPVPFLEGLEGLQGEAFIMSHALPGVEASGVVLNAEGYVLTSSQIAQWTGGEVDVVLSDGRKLGGEVIGSDPLSGIAVVKVDSRSLRPAVFGNSDRIRTGSWVIILGNAFGVSPSMALGMVNAVREDGTIQVSANVSPGSSGSPVFNSTGEVIGILNASLSDPFTLRLGLGEGSEGDEFRVLNMPSRGSSLLTPINNVLEVADELITHGRVERGWLGVHIQELDEDLREGLGVKSGIIVKRVVESSPAEGAGLEVGDVILEYDGNPVESTSDLRRLVMGTAPGERVTLKIRHDGETKRVRVQITSREEKAVGVFEWPDLASLYEKEWREQLKDGAERLRDLVPKEAVSEELKAEIKRLKEMVKELAESLRRLEAERQR